MAISYRFGWKLVLVFSVPVIVACSGTNSVENRFKLTEQKGVSSGEFLFLQHCSICHGKDGRLGASGASDLAQSVLDSLQITEVVMKGRNAMPAMKELVGTEEQIASVVAHLMKLRK
jgi:mono/diheme cytochrome c family protein